MKKLCERPFSMAEIVAHFQPQVDLENGRIVGAEALARWNHPERGVLSAAEFVPLAEESDLILEVDAAIQALCYRGPHGSPACRRGA